MNIYILNTTSDGIRMARALQKDFDITGMIGLTDRDPGDVISGYVSSQTVCKELGIPFYGVEDYSLKSAKDKELLLSLDIDVLIVSGWQRLVPSWLINHVKHHTLGFHGSPWGITKGRGRSPQNWAIILGEQSFSLSLFNITPGIDDGEVFETREFQYEPCDDIKTSHYKVTLLSHQMTKEHLIRLQNDAVTSTPQGENAHYLPQRKPEDGLIDWSCTTESIDRFIRALTRPYPGAQTILNGVLLTIWKARPLNIPGSFPGSPGKIIDVYESGNLIVATGDGLLLVEDYTGLEGTPVPGDEFESADIVEQMKIIIERHTAKYPDLPIADAILSHAERVKV